LRVRAVLLAAGLSKRMGKDKLMLEYNGKTLLQHSVELLNSLPVDERIIVTSDTRSDKIDLPPGIRLIINPNPEEGISSSIRFGLEAITGISEYITHLLFLNADQPKLATGDVIPIIEAAKKFPDKIIFPAVNNEPNSPTMFPVSYRTELIELSKPPVTGQEGSGGKIIRDRNPQNCCSITPQAPGNFTDIDTMENYNELF